MKAVRLSNLPIILLITWFLVAACQKTSTVPGNVSVVEPSLSSSVATPMLTITPDSPAYSSDHYHLREWTEMDALRVITLLNDRWEQIVTESNNWIYAMQGNNELRAYIALAAEETLWRFPNMPDRNSLEWQITYDLAVTGEEEASQRMALLLEQHINQQSNHQIPKVDVLMEYGFTSELRGVPNLFGNNQDGWLLTTGKQHHHNFHWDGAVFSIERMDNGRFIVLPIGSVWKSWHGSGFSVTVGEHTQDMKPEIMIAHETVSGSGSIFASWGLCLYQWSGEAWISLLNSDSDLSCLSFGGYFGSWEYVNSNSVDNVQVTVWKPDLSPVCAWNTHYLYAWNGNSYELASTAMDIPATLPSLDQMICLETAWRTTVLPNDLERLIPLTESVLVSWPAKEVRPEQPTLQFPTFDANGKAQVRFQLGRLYALLGDMEQARSTFDEVVRNVDRANDEQWLLLAQAYTVNLGNLSVAEQNFADTLHLNTSASFPVGISLSAVEIGRETARQLFAGESPTVVIDQLESALANPDLGCPTRSTCAILYYLLALAYEAAGNEEEAVANYWRVWNDYPESLQAVIVQRRLEE